MPTLLRFLYCVVILLILLSIILSKPSNEITVFQQAVLDTQHLIFQDGPGHKQQQPTPTPTPTPLRECCPCTKEDASHPHGHIHPEEEKPFDPWAPFFEENGVRYSAASCAGLKYPRPYIDGYPSKTLMMFDGADLLTYKYVLIPRRPHGGPYPLPSSSPFSEQRYARVAFLQPFAGSPPPWIGYFLESCRHNADMADFLFFVSPSFLEKVKEIVGSDPDAIPPNVKFHTIFSDKNTLADIGQYFAKKLGISTNFVLPSKLCDFKPALGLIFREYLEERATTTGGDHFTYTHWGFGDIDLVFGDLSRFILNEHLVPPKPASSGYESKKHTVITILAQEAETIRVAGPFTIYENNPESYEFFKRVPNWKDILEGRSPSVFDERPASDALRDSTDIRMVFYFASLTDMTTYYYPRDEIVDRHKQVIPAGSQFSFRFVDGRLFAIPPVNTQTGIKCTHEEEEEGGEKKTTCCAVEMAFFHFLASKHRLEEKHYFEPFGWKNGTPWKIDFAPALTFASVSPNNNRLS